MSIPSLIYFLRCAPCWKVPQLLSTYDNCVQSSLEKILNCEFSIHTWKQVSLPVKLGGLGVKHGMTSAIPCFIASYHSVLPLIHQLIPEDITDCALPQAIQAYETEFGSIPTENPNSQKSWETPIFNQIVKDLTIHYSTPLEKARILAVQQEEAGLWLQAFPSPQIGTHMDDRSFQIAVALRLGATICLPHTCRCGSEVTPQGTHGLSCKKSAGRFSRHSFVNDIIARAWRTAEVPVELEPRGHCKRNNGRADGKTLFPVERGKCLFWDFTCADTFAPSYLPATSITPGAAAKEAEQRKFKKYEDLAAQGIFVPIAIETSGVWGKEGRHMIQKIGSKISNLTSEARSTYYLMQRISIAVQRGNVASILGTFPSGKELNEIFYF